MLKLMKHRKSKYKKQSTALLKLATAPAAINVSMLIGTAEDIVYRYLCAVNSGRPDLLPAKGMEESFYYHTLEHLMGRDTGNPSGAVILNSIRLYDYDCRVMYIVQKITYRAACTINQTDRDFYATFCRDERMGWLLERIDADEVKA